MGYSNDYGRDRRNNDVCMDDNNDGDLNMECDHDWLHKGECWWCRHCGLTTNERDDW